jgi:hypothetical protein
VKAGLGVRAHFPFLDIFLPVEAHLGHYDAAWSREFALTDFYARPELTRSPFSIAGKGGEAGMESALIWGPYLSLPVGEYVFEPFLEVEEAGLVAVDVALDTKAVAYSVFPTPGETCLRFSNDKDGARVEFRLWPVEGEALAGFRFYGGRLSKRGASSALHQSEYLTLLVELLALRSSRTGMLRDGKP